MVGAVVSGLTLRPPASAMAREPRAVTGAPTATAQKETVTNKQDAKAAYAAALASGKGLGAPTGYGHFDNRADNIHSEVIINGKVVARTYNSGAIEIADEYGFLANELGFNADKETGPRLAASRVARIEALLQGYGTAMDVAGSPKGANTFLEVVRAATAKTQDEWVADQARFGLLKPGSLFSTSV